MFVFNINFPDNVKMTLAADVMRQKHTTEKGQGKRIDIEKQYVGLKLLSQNQIGIMHRDALETPDHYQSKLEQHGGKDIKDEDLVKPGDHGKYILIRGRAGIGKTTLVQRLIWKWANGVWATQFKALFLLNLRYLMLVDKHMDLPHLLNMYPVYNTASSGVTLSMDWLEKNQDNIGLVLGKNTYSWFRKVN